MDAEGIAKSSPGKRLRPELHSVPPSEEATRTQSVRSAVACLRPPLSDRRQEDVYDPAMWINCYPRKLPGGQPSCSKYRVFGFHFRKRKSVSRLLCHMVHSVLQRTPPFFKSSLNQKVYQHPVHGWFQSNVTSPHGEGGVFVQ